MQYINELQQVSMLLLVIGGLLFIAAIISLIMRSPSVYAALSAILGGVLFGGLLYEKVQLITVCAAVSVFAIFCGTTYLLFFCLLALQRMRAERKRRRAEIARRLQYTLPDRENTYVRTRLNTALTACQDEETVQALSVKLGYARELLGKVQASPLSVGERLQTEEMGKLLTLYKGKDSWTVKEMNGLNEICAFLLKLSAKYSV